MLVELEKGNKRKRQQTFNFNYIVKEASWLVVIYANNISIKALLWVRVFHDCQKKTIKIKTNLCTYVFILYFCIEIIALKLKISEYLGPL